MHVTSSEQPTTEVAVVMFANRNCVHDVLISQECVINTLSQLKCFLAGVRGVALFSSEAPRDLKFPLALALI